jgi:hypothetical protein
MEIVEGLTKGKASGLINSAKQSGVLPREENKINAEKLFEAIDRKEKKERLRLISEDISEAIHVSQKRRVSIKEIERVKQHLAKLFEELTEHIDNRIAEVDDAECERKNREDEKRESGELD